MSEGEDFDLRLTNLMRWQRWVLDGEQGAPPRPMDRLPEWWEDEPNTLDATWARIRAVHQLRGLRAVAAKANARPARVVQVTEDSQGIRWNGALLMISDGRANPGPLTRRRAGGRAVLHAAGAPGVGLQRIERSELKKLNAALGGDARATQEGDGLAFHESNGAPLRLRWQSQPSS